jgi:hypothetical protein
MVEKKQITRVAFTKNVTDSPPIKQVDKGRSAANRCDPQRSNSVRPWPPLRATRARGSAAPSCSLAVASLRAAVDAAAGRKCALRSRQSG